MLYGVSAFGAKQFSSGARSLAGGRPSLLQDVLRGRRTEIEELNGFRAYMGWSLWDVIAARSTEGESGLIPRQEYETISFLQMWALYPRMMREITEEIGVDGVIELGRTPRREVGSKLNITRSWSPMKRNGPNM